MSERQQISKPHQPRAQWRTRMGFILAALGSAVGLGNIWRFSYLCSEYGGGSFLIPYVIALIIVGIPLMILELGLGHKMRGSAPMSFAKIGQGRAWEWCGWWAVNCAMYGIMLYYSVIIAWCLSYVFFSTNLGWGADPNHFFFNEFLQKSSGPGELGDIRAPILFALLAVWGVCWFIVFFGVQKGVERANKIFMPILFSLVGILVIWCVFFLEGSSVGITEYLRPKMSVLKSPKVWVDAFSQIFFTLSLAFGIMITYASYLPRKADIVQDAIVVCVGNCLFSFLAGFAVFGTLGYMSVSLGKPVGDLVQETIGLAFVVYPQAISLMSPMLAKAFGFLFFGSLVIAGLSSAISLVEAFSAAVVDKFHYPRKTVVSVVCTTGFLGSIVFTAKGGLFWVDILDHIITHYGLVIIGILECIVIGWIFKASKLREHINQHVEKTKIKLSIVWDVAVRFVLPLVLLILLTHDIVKETSETYEGYPLSAILLIGHHWLGLALIAALFVSMRPWRKELYHDGE